jgi:ABC-2 type transport system permease protein
MKKTAKFIVLGVLGVFLSGLSVISARYFNVLMEMALEQEGVSVSLPESTVYESYTQFYSNFTQIFLIVFIFVGVAFFTRDKTKNHYPLLFTKPIKRQDFILSKSIIITIAFIASMIIASVFFIYYTLIIFDTFHYGKFALSLLAYSSLMILLLHIGLYFSIIFKNYIAPAGITLLVFFLFSLINLLSFGVFKYLPTHLSAYPLMIMEDQVDIPVLVISSLIGLLVSAGLLVLTIRTFNKKSLL